MKIPKQNILLVWVVFHYYWSVFQTQVVYTSVLTADWTEQRGFANWKCTLLPQSQPPQKRRVKINEQNRVLQRRTKKRREVPEKQKLKLEQKCSCDDFWRSLLSSLTCTERMRWTIFSIWRLSVAAGDRWCLVPLWNIKYCS